MDHQDGDGQQKLQVVVCGAESSGPDATRAPSPGSHGGRRCCWAGAGFLFLVWVWVLSVLLVCLLNCSNCSFILSLAVTLLNVFASALSVVADYVSMYAHTDIH